MREALLDFCIANRKETLLRQWDREKHAPLGPSNVSQGSHERVFWRCENNHVWNAAVYARTKVVDARIVRDADTADGHGGQPEKGLVAMCSRPCLEGGHLPPGPASSAAAAPSAPAEREPGRHKNQCLPQGGLYIDILCFGGKQIEKEVLITPVVLLHGSVNYANGSMGSGCRGIEFSHTI